MSTALNVVGTFLSRYSNKDKNRETKKEFIDKYKGQDVYIHFANSFSDSKGQKITQIGINTRQGANYLTPFGIYMYPIDHIEGGFKVNAANVWVLKLKNVKALEVSEFGESAYKKARDTIVDKYIKPSYLKSDFLRKRSLEYWVDIMEREVGSSSDCFYHKLLNFIERSDYDVVPELFSYSGTKYTGTLFTKVLRGLGYNAVSDKTGKGCIDESNPYQIVVFSSKNIEIVDSYSERVQER